MMIAATLLTIALIAVLAMVMIVQRLIHICQPNEVLIFSGAQRKVGARKVGYRLVHGGRGIRIPLLEKVDRLDLTNMVIDIRVTGAYSKGGIPLNVEGMANVKVASEQPTIGNAIERFLGKNRNEVIRVAKETLEGNLRGVLATLTPEEVNHDRVKFAQSLLHEADQDLKKLGLALDTLKIQNVSDDKGYLDSLGRKQSADLQMRSRIAEADHRAAASERAAHNAEVKEIARLEADFATAKADVSRRIVEAQTLKGAGVAEQRAIVAAEIERMKAEVSVQTARIEQVKLQLLADTVRPAEARKQEMVAQARGASSRILEEGRATADSISAMARTWESAGDAARQILVAQKLGKLMEGIMGTVGSAPVEKMTFIDARLTQSAGGELATRATIASEQLKELTGLDVPALLGRLGTTRGNGAVTPPVLPRTSTANGQ